MKVRGRKPALEITKIAFFFIGQLHSARRGHSGKGNPAEIRPRIPEVGRAKGSAGYVAVGVCPYPTVLINGQGMATTMPARPSLQPPGLPVG